MSVGGYNAVHKKNLNAFRYYYAYICPMSLSCLLRFEQRVCWYVLYRTGRGMLFCFESFVIAGISCGCCCWLDDTWYQVCAFYGRFGVLLYIRCSGCLAFTLTPCCFIVIIIVRYCARSSYTTTTVFTTGVQNVFMRVYARRMLQGVQSRVRTVALFVPLK